MNLVDLIINILLLSLDRFLDKNLSTMAGMFLFYAMLNVCLIEKLVEMKRGKDEDELFQAVYAEQYFSKVKQFRKITK